MALTDSEKERARYHLGYPEQHAVASIQLGIPRPLQTAFLVETALNNIIPDAEDRVRRLLKIMDDIECRLIGAQERLSASALGSLKLRDDEPDKLEREYVRWGHRLADTLGAPIYAYSTRYNAMWQGAAGNIPVR